MKPCFNAPLHATVHAMRVLKPGDRIRVAASARRKRWFTFAYWDGGLIVSKSGHYAIAPASIDRLNGGPVDFTAGVGATP